MASTKEMTEDERKAALQAYRELEGGDLAQEVLELIEDNRDRWNQGSWRQDLNGMQPCTGAPEGTIEAWAEDPLNPECTTSFCFAGWVGAVKGVKWAKGNGEMIGDPDKCDCKGLCCVKEAHQKHISTFARGQLGLAEYEGDLLFNGDNSIHTIRDYVRQIVETGDIDESDVDEEDDDE